MRKNLISNDNELVVWLLTSDASLLLLGVTASTYVRTASTSRHLQTDRLFHQPSIRSTSGMVPG